MDICNLDVVFNPGHDRSPIEMSERLLKQLYFPPFRAAIAAGVMTAMEGYHEIGGVPMASSAHYLKDELRFHLNFSGVLVSDYAEVHNLHVWHKVAETSRDAIRIALTDTTIDISMGVNLGASSNFNDTVSMFTDGTVSEARLNDSVRRVLQLKEELGLFEQPRPLPLNDPLVGSVGQDSDWELALNASRESITLLKNVGQLLPLPRTANLLVTGPACDSLVAQTGGTYSTLLMIMGASDVYLSAAR